MDHGVLLQLVEKYDSLREDAPNFVFTEGLSLVAILLNEVEQ